VIKTVEIDWNEFCKRHSSLMDRLLPALRSLNADSIALRTPEWSILPRWEDGAFYFESYENEPEAYSSADEDVQLRVTGVPFGSI
jgi:hypothetical protein